MMQNSFDINDQTRSRLDAEVKVEGIKVNHQGITLSLNSFRCSENEQTFRKEVHGDKAEAEACEQTFRKEAYIVSTDKDALNLNLKTDEEIDSLIVIPRSPENCWNINLFLVYLSQETTDEDLEKIKHLFTDTGDDENVTHSFANASSLQVYELLQRRNFIKYNDLLYLQIIMAVLRKDPLIAMVYEYAKSRSNVLHFDPPLKDIVICDSLEEVSVRGADFRCYTTKQLHELCSRINEMVAVFTKNQRSTSNCRLVISCVDADRCDPVMHLLVDKTTETELLKGQRRRSHTVLCDTGLQTIDHQQELEQENIALKRQLSEAEYLIQEQSRELTKLREAVESKDAQLRHYNDHQESFQTCHAENEDKCDNLDANEEYTKSIEFELNSLKKENAVLLMKSSSSESLQENYNEMLQKNDELAKENTELKVEKTEMEVQMGMLKKNFEGLEEKLKRLTEEENSLIAELRNELELTAASLLNAQNDKRLHGLTKCLEQIASMSMTVKKVYGNFDPAHEQILPIQDELYRKALSGKIGRIYPQIYHQSEHSANR